MTTKADLVGLGTPPMVADVLGDTPTLFTAVGTVVGSAAQIPGNQFTTVVNAGTSAVKVPKVGGDAYTLGSGGKLGSEYRIINMTANPISVFAASNDAGSLVTFIASALSVAGATGITTPIGRMLVMVPITVSTWVVLGSANSS